MLHCDSMKQAQPNENITEVKPGQKTGLFVETKCE